MTSALRLRKALLATLQERVIPSLRGAGARRLALANWPLRVPAAFAVRAMEHPPLEESAATRVYPEGRLWEDVQLHAIRFPALFCVFEGEVDFPMGVTATMLNRHRAARAGRTARAGRAAPCGGYLISLPSPAFLLFPPGVPQRTGVYPPWWRDTPHTGSASFLNVRVLPIGALCHLTTMQDGHCKNDYSLLVKDNQLASAIGILLNELSTPAPDPQITQAQLVTLMLRLQRSMKTEVPLVTDGLYSRFPDSDPVDPQEHLLHHPAIEQAHKYIQLHLHEPLTPAAIAEHVRLTPTHLNRLFKLHAGMSTMSYVIRLRVETAQLLLRTSTLSVQEVGRLVGFRQLAHFSRTFRRHTGDSPLKFRQRENDRA